MTRRRWIANTWTATTATLSGEQAEHLARVLRAAPGQVYDIVAGGFLHRGEILSVQPSEVVFALHEELESDAALPLHLLLAIFKFDHMEWAIEKATELGVARITPVLARRTEKHLAQASAKRAERWRRIALEASKQSRRTTIPEISEPAPLKSALEDADEPMRILLSETEQSTSIASVLAGASGDQSRYALAIGPEGGWTPEEMNLFTQHGWLSVTLGPRILRAETAAIAAIAILSSHLT
jgi:16S rRNA (uracil1498-N3)-methyltransferase